MNKTPLDCSLYGSELFYGFEDILIRTPTKTLEKHLYSMSKLAIIYKVFIYFLELVIKDIIYNDVRFQVNEKSKYRLHMNKLSGKEFEEAYRRGKFWEINPTVSNNTGYTLALSRIAKTKEDWKIYEKTVPFYIGWRLKEYITDKVNSGGGYSG